MKKRRDACYLAPTGKDGRECSPAAILTNSETFLRQRPQQLSFSSMPSEEARVFGTGNSCTPQLAYIRFPDTLAYTHKHRYSLPLVIFCQFDIDNRSHF